MPIEFDSPAENGAKIRIVGVGGGGTNAVHSMITRGLSGVDFIAINTARDEILSKGISDRNDSGCAPVKEQFQSLQKADRKASFHCAYRND